MSLMSSVRVTSTPGGGLELGGKSLEQEEDSACAAEGEQGSGELAGRFEEQGEELCRSE